MVKIPSFFLAQQRGGEVFQIFERIEADLMPACRLAQTVIQRRIETDFGIAERGHKHRDSVLIGRLQNAPLILALLGQIRSDSVVQLVGAHDFVVVPGFENGRHDFFDVIEILLGLERVVDAVIARSIEFLVGNLRIGAEMRPAGGLHQTMGHQSARGDDRVRRCRGQ